MATRGRFKGWKSESTVALMSEADQKKYRAFVEAVQNAKKNGMELPEPPEYDNPIVTASTNKSTNKTGIKRGRSAKKVTVNINEDVDNIDEEDTTEDIAEDTPKNWWEENTSMNDVQETVIHHCSREGFCIIETNERYWKNKIARLHEKYPDKVLYQEKYCVEDVIRVKIPYKYMKRINIVTRTMSEEQRQFMSELGKNNKKENAQTENIEVNKNVEENIGENIVGTEKVVESTVENTVENTVKNTEENTAENEVIITSGIIEGTNICTPVIISGEENIKESPGDSLEENEEGPFEDSSDETRDFEESENNENGRYANQEAGSMAGRTREEEGTGKREEEAPDGENDGDEDDDELEW